MNPSIYSTHNTIENFHRFDLSASAFRSIIRFWPPVPDVRTLKIDFNPNGDHYSPYGTWKLTFALVAVPMKISDGAVRWYFLCPQCEARKCVLYLPPEHYPEHKIACQGCYGLSFPRGAASAIQGGIETEAAPVQFPKGFGVPSFKAVSGLR